MTILALDQASKTSGYAVFINGALYTYGKFTFDQSDMGERLVSIRNKVKELINEYSPDKVIFEDIQQQNNVVNNIQTFKILAQVYGVISELLTELHIPNTSVLAASWKSTLSIKGKTRPEQKRNAQQYVIDKYGKKPTQDECDAICIGEHYIRASTNDWSE